MNEERIEAARVAFVNAWEAENQKIGEGSGEPGQRSRAGILAALAIFEEACAPTEEDRELMANLIPLGFREQDGVRNVVQAADRIFAEGFRRVLRAEPDA